MPAPNLRRKLGRPVPQLPHKDLWVLFCKAVGLLLLRIMLGDPKNSNVLYVFMCGLPSRKE